MNESKRDWLPYVYVGLIIVLMLSLITNISAQNKIEEKADAALRLAADLQAVDAEQNATLFGLETSLADQWLSQYTNGQKVKVNAWEDGHAAYFSCIATQPVTSIRTMRNYYSESEGDVFAKYLVTSYPGHDLVYARNGTVECYATPIMTLDPLPVDCLMACGGVA